MDAAFKHGFALGAYRIDPLSGEVAGPDGVKRVQPKFIDVLLCLAERGGKVVERDARAHGIERARLSVRRRTRYA